MKLLKIICFVISAYTANAAVLPVDKCSLEDSECLTQAFQKAMPIFMEGMPDQEVEVLDVMEMEDFKFDLSGLQFGLQEGKMKGLKSSIVDSVKWDLKNNYFETVFHLDAVVKGHYTAGGRILILPITGDGQMKLKLKHVEIKFRIEYVMEKEHVVPKKFSYEFDVKENANFILTNLFNGNKELSDTMLVFLNENWKQISMEFGRPMIDVAAKKIYKNISKFFKNVPIAEIANL